MKKISYIIIAIISLVQIGCQTDPWEDIEDGSWSNERSILSIKLENQIGQPNIVRVDDTTGEVFLSIDASAVSDLSNIKLLDLVVSYGAKTTVEKGEALNFENADNSAVISVTSPTGKTRDYTIKANPFTETVLGTYQIDQLVLYGGTGPEYGGGAVLNLTDKPWIWPENNGPEVELDNYLVFELSGITEEGNTYGVATNYAGDDQLYADFQYVLDPITDVNHFYRQIPQGSATWERNYTTGTISFTFEDGHKTTGAFVGSGTEDLGNGNVNVIENQAFAFDLNGTDDWDAIYTDYDKFVKKPRRYWIEVTKTE